MGRLQQSVIDEVVRRKQIISKSNSYIPWIVLNACVALLIYSDICHGSITQFLPFLPSWIYVFEYLLCAIFTINTILDSIFYFFPLLGVSSITLSSSQKKLLGVSQNDSSYIADQPIQKTKDNSKVADMSSVIDSFCLSRSSFLSNSVSSMLSGRNVSEYNIDANSTLSSPNRSITSDSWSYYNPHKSPRKSSSSFTQSNLSLSQHDNFVRKRKSLSDSTQKYNSGYISDEQSLEQYLKDYEEKEQSSLRDASTTVSPSFWNYSRSPIDFTSQLAKYQYQIASRSPQSSTSHKDDSDSPTKYCNDEAWKKFGVSSEELDVWIERLRKWITKTVIIDVVNEINSINKILSNTRSRNLTIGEVSISTLGQIAFTSGSQIPHLNTLLPFLDVTSNQEYLVYRLKNLASGGCMSTFKWNGGGTFKGKPWDEHLPTDCMIIMHLLCSYLDARTPFHPTYADGKTFTSQYFIKTPDKPDTKIKDCLYIYQSQINPPIYKLVTGEITYELPEGHNNMFQVILLFLYHVRKDHSGMLGRLSLGSSGVNMLWILDS